MDNKSDENFNNNYVIKKGNACSGGKVPLHIAGEEENNNETEKYEYRTGNNDDGASSDTSSQR